MALLMLLTRTNLIRTTKLFRHVSNKFNRKLTMDNKTSINKEYKDRKTLTWSIFKFLHLPYPSTVLTSWLTVNHLNVETSLRMVWDTATMMIWLKRLQSHPQGLFSKVSRFHLPWVYNHSSSCKIAWTDSL